MLMVNHLIGFGCGGDCSCTPAYVTGNRSASITVTDSGNVKRTIDAATSILVNGDFTADSTNAFVMATDANAQYTVDSTRWIKFDFGFAVKITEAKWYQSGTGGGGSWQWQGSNNNSDWTDIGAVYSLGGAGTTTQTTLNANTAGYRYYRMIGSSGLSNNNDFMLEIEFKQCAC